MSPQYGELRPTSGWDRFGGLRHLSKFQRLSRLGFVTAATSFTTGQPIFAGYLAVSWAATLYIHLLGLLPLTEFRHVQIWLCDQVLHSYYWQRYCMALQHSSEASQTLWRCTRNGIMELSQRAPPIFGWAAITLGIGPYSSLLFLCFFLFVLCCISLYLYVYYVFCFSLLPQVGE